MDCGPGRHGSGMQPEGGMMSGPSKVTPEHLRRLAYLYVRQSTLHQVRENRESTLRQYDLKARAQTLGWHTDQIIVIDDDLGLSGANASDRSGFQRMVADVGLGRVGVVMGIEVSRFARNSTDWHRLLEICAITNTLILDEDGIYDPSHFNDRLLLGLKGTMSEAELHMLRARLIGGALNKARRGELWLRPPIGFVHDHNRRLVLDPDEQVQKAVRLLFETFHRTGSALRVVRHLATHAIQWPRRIRSGPRAGELVFGPLVHSRVLSILHNPCYAGVYFYGRTRRRKMGINGKGCYWRLPREEWKVFLPGAHPGYTSWEEFESNQAKLQANLSGRRKGPAREGAALLQGLVVCGICGDRMTVQYATSKGRAVPRYVCQYRNTQRGQGECQNILGGDIDEAVGQVVLKAVTPTSLDVALQVFAELQARKAEVDRLRRAQVERARQEAEMAQRQYLLVRPENRLVADTLERQWNEKLQSLTHAEEEYTQASKADSSELSAEAKDRIQALASDLPRVWNDPRTPMRDRKRMLRLLIEDVSLVRENVIRMHIRWKGGTTTSLERPLPLRAADAVRTPPVIVEQIRALAPKQTNDQIANTLNGQGLQSGTGKSFTGPIVRTIRYVYGIPSLAQHLCRAGWLTSKEIAARLGIHSRTAIRFAREGLLPTVRVDDRGTILFSLPTDSLPKAHPGKRFRDRRRYPKCVPHMRKEVQYAA